jgi:hypothetical protein
MKTLRIPGTTPRRKLTVAGYLLNQKRAVTAWSGLTARVQNVAVEEHSFFDVTSDPGFRKYISGEIWILDDVDRERLINIDRSSFSRECVDYQVVQRYMSRAILDFKANNVQRPQRLKVELKRRLEQHAATLNAVGQVVGMAALEGAARGLPSSEQQRGRLGGRQSIADVLEGLGAQVVIVDESEDADARRPYSLEVSADGGAIVAKVQRGLVEPRVDAGGIKYRVSFADGRVGDAPVLIRNRPREIIFNTAHRVHNGRDAHTRYQLSLALELAFLLSDYQDPADLYYRMLGFMEGI